MKVCGSTVKLQLILDVLSAVEAGGIRGVAVKCLDITKNSDCEGYVSLLPVAQGKPCFSGGYPHAGIGAEYGSAFAVKGNTPTDSGRHRGTGGKEGVGEKQYSDQGEYRDPQPYS